MTVKKELEAAHQCNTEQNWKFGILAPMWISNDNFAIIFQLCNFTPLFKNEGLLLFLTMLVGYPLKQ